MKQKKAIWIASYPKSGNTFVRVLLENYLSGRDEPIGINEMNLVKGDMSGQLVNASGAHEVGVTVEQGLLRRISVHRQLVQEGRSRVYIKTHLPNLTVLGTSLIASDLSRRAIYVHRDPRDVCVSFADHLGKSVEEIADQMINHQFAHDGRPESVVEFIGSWQQHMLSWTLHPPFPVLTVSYERLVSDTRTVLIEMVRFLELKLDSKRCSFAVEASSFKRLQAQENRTAFRESSPHATSGRFFRNGVVGGWSTVLSSGLAEQLVARTMPLSRLLGYC